MDGSLLQSSDFSHTMHACMQGTGVWSFIKMSRDQPPGQLKAGDKKDEKCEACEGKPSGSGKSAGGRKDFPPTRK
jgi:hypothetical protein